MSSDNWCFTLHDPTGPIAFDDEYMSYLVYQLEQCPDTGRHHFQGFLQLHSRRSMGKVKKILGDNRVHLERMRGTASEAANYCKDDTKIVLDGPWEYGSIQKRGGNKRDFEGFARACESAKSLAELRVEWAPLMAGCDKWCRNTFADVKERMARERAGQIELVLFPWQADLYDRLAEPPVHRRVYWIWSENTNTGKTTFFQWLSQTMPVCTMYNWKLDHVLYRYNYEPIIMFTLSKEESVDKNMMRVLECLSDHGTKTAMLYECPTKFIACHVVVCANVGPPTWDRIYEIRI